jgi:predicted protein tyrosine phosphatase
MITLSDAEWLTAAIATMEAKYLVSLMSPSSMIETPQVIALENHLKLPMEDITGQVDGYITPNRTHIEQLLEFGNRLDSSSGVIVHCTMGMSRSPAAVLILLAQHNPGRELEVADTFFHEVPQTNPNTLLLRIGDDLLGCHGDLFSATCTDASSSNELHPSYCGSLEGFHSFPLKLRDHNA